MEGANYFDNDYPKFQKIRKNKKRKKANELFIERQSLKMTSGSVWGVHDRAVPFDWARNEKDYKDSLRPAVILEMPDEIPNSRFAWVAPGTSKNHDNERFVLKVEVPPENLNKTTWFLLKYKWFVLQKDLQKRYTELSTYNKKKMNRILEELKNVG